MSFFLIISRETHKRDFTFHSCAGTAFTDGPSTGKSIRLRIYYFHSHLTVTLKFLSQLVLKPHRAHSNHYNANIMFYSFSCLFF